MSLVPSLLHSILQVNGEALVLHVGEKPYVVTPTGQVDLAPKGLTFEAVSGIVGQLLSIESQRALDEFGAAQYELPANPEFPAEHFTIVAARGGDDVWCEIRRRRVPDDDFVPADIFEEAPGAAPAVDLSVVPAEMMPATAPVAVAQKPAAAPPPQPKPAAAPPPKPVAAPQPTLVAAPPPPKPVAVPPVASAPAPPPQPPAPPVTAAAPVPPQPIVTPPVAAPPPRPVAAPPPRPVAAPPVRPSPPPVPPPAYVPPPAPRPVAVAEPPAAVRAIVPPPPPAEPPRPTFVAPPPPVLPSAAQVVPLARTPIRAETPPPAGFQPTGLDRLLRLAAARGASTLYLASHMPPSIRVEGDVLPVDGEAALGPNDVESLLLVLMPQRNHEALRAGAATEWMCDVAGVGRVRCMTFRDHRGPGGVFRIMPGRVVSADQLGLSRHLQALAIEPEGLLLVTGPRLSGKRTLISAFVDLVNRTRRDHVITVESEISVVHEQVNAFISQREARGGPAEMLAVAQAALREDPDILVLESLRAPGLISVALEAAAAGQLVIGGFPAHTTTSAIDRIINACAPEERRQVQLALAENLRGGVAQLLVRRNGGGRLAAREVLLNTPAVASAIAEGRTSQLPIAIEGGRRYGMVSMNDALAGLVQSGSVDAREAYRAAADRMGLLATLERLGLDVSFVERRA